MTVYYIELTKTIVVPWESETATTPEEAVAEAIEDDSGFDGAWDRAEVTGVCLIQEVICE